MSDRAHERQEIESLLREVAARFLAVADPTIDAKCVILTGSFASYVKSLGRHEPSWRSVPDANIYPIIGGDETAILRGGAVLHATIAAAVEERVRRGIPLNVSIDVHPFAFAGNPAIVRPEHLNLQLTTRVISTAAVYGQHCWNGWLGNYIVLAEKVPGFMDSLLSRKRLPRDEAWLRDMYLALLSYTNALLVLPLYSTVDTVVFDEAYRYFKEISKDGIAIGLTDAEFAGGRLYEILYDSRRETVPFYVERYGSEAAALAQGLQNVEDDYLRRRSAGGGIELGAKALRLKEIVFRDGFQARLAEVRKRGGISTEVFATQPLWF